MKSNLSFLIVILIILVIVMIIYLDIPSMVVPDFELDIGINSIGEAISKAFEGIARSIKF